MALELAAEVNSSTRVAHRFPRCPREQSLVADRTEFRRPDLAYQPQLCSPGRIIHPPSLKKRRKTAGPK